MPRRPEQGTSKQATRTMSRWAEQVTAIYPPSWLESGGPIRTCREHDGTRHVPDASGFGGYDLFGE